MVELASACGLFGVQSSPIGSQQRNIVVRHDGTSPSGLNLPLEVMLLRNLFVHLEGFYQKRDILGGFLGWCVSLPGSPAQQHRLLPITSENGSLWDTDYIVRVWEHIPSLILYVAQ